VKDFPTRHAKQVKQAAGDQPCAPDAGATVNGENLALNKLGMQLSEQSS
jgi:hypothetical protein